MEGKRSEEMITGVYYILCKKIVTRVCWYVEVWNGLKCRNTDRNDGRYLDEKRQEKDDKL